ncbi:HEAT repeat domain-containing protein [Anatilimnocola floriformis]|uniref:HEAT repeat domain-containing protein n=1 Tax=Anatilimnocola floriformis TaxID=2948575 RepID=UPI0020C277DB|nr:HEAT repeat domain-containing protein [Anatilimnocola floriformis]
MPKLFVALAFVLCAANSFAQVPTVLGKTADDWHLRLAMGDGQDRHLAAWALAQSGKSADRWLLHQTHHPDPVVRYWLIQGLGRNAANEKTKDGREPYLKVLRKLLTDESPAPRLAAADQLARLGAVDEAMPVLIAGLDEPQDSAGMQAAATLAALGKQAAPAQAKLQTAAANGGEYVKRLANRALQNLGVPSKNLEE